LDLIGLRPSESSGLMSLRFRVSCAAPHRSVSQRGQVRPALGPDPPPAGPGVWAL